MKRPLLLLGSATLLLACGGNGDAPPLRPITETGGSTSTTGGRIHTGGKSSQNAGGGGLATGGVTGVGGVSTGGVGGVGGGSAVGGVTGSSTSSGTVIDPSTLRPIVKIISPPEVLDPGETGDAGVAASPVLIETPTQVVCQATKGSAAEATPVAASSVQITLTPAGGTAVSKGGTKGDGDTYSAIFAIQDIPTGAVTIECRAADQATPPNTVTSTIKTFIDHGPRISDVVPVANAPFALRKSVHFEFKVTPVGLDDNDPGSAVASVQLKVGDVSFTPVLDSRGYYTAEVDFGDATKFPQTPTGQVPVVITASNGRQPTPATATTSYYIVLDGEPPVISITSPPDGSVIGGQETLTFTVTDGLSDVDPQMVVVNLGANQSVGYPYKADDALTWKFTKNGATSTFSFTFDSAKFDKTDSQVSISVIAADLAGNQSTSSVKLYYLDNQPPFVSLDPPNVRLVIPAPDEKVHCSKPFDPVGPRMPDNGEIVNSFEFYRAFVWDRTNGKESQSFFVFAGVDPARVQLFVQSDTGKGIIYDKSGDGVCDSIVEEERSRPGQPYLVPVTDYGTADYLAHDLSIAPSVEGGLCVESTKDTNPLCAQQSSDMIVAVHQTNGGQTANISAIYAVQAVAGAINCTGLDWDISNHVQEGWVCVAAEATDGVGNVGISAPIAICFDNEQTATKPSCATGLRHEISTEPPPKCVMNNCVAPSRSRDGDYQASTNSVVPYDIGNPLPFVIVYRE